MANRRIPRPRSETIPAQPDPKLAELCSRLPPTLGLRIDGLVEKARKLPIHPNRVVKYAFLLATAEQQASGDAVSKRQTRRSKGELAGELHGFPEGYERPKAAIKQYRRNRRGRQQIHASLEGGLMKWETVEQVVRKHRLSLPVHHQAEFSDERLGDVRTRMLKMFRITVLDEQFLDEKSCGREPSVTTQTYIWWNLAHARYRGKTNEMYELAKVWKLTAVKDVETFRSMVNQACRGVQSMRFPIGSAWESALSETP
jgi:hypothetical protein